MKKSFEKIIVNTAFSKKHKINNLKHGVIDMKSQKHNVVIG